MALLVGFASCGVREVTCTQCQGTGKCNFYPALRIL